MGRSGWVGIFVCICVFGCARPLGGRSGRVATDTPEPSRPVFAFPTLEVVRQSTMNVPPLAQVISTADDVGSTVGRWELRATPAAGDPTYAPSGPLEALLTEQAQGSDIRRSASLRCAAQETARYHIRRGDLPARWLRLHLARACGSVVADYGVSVSSFEVAGLSAENVLTQRRRFIAEAWNDMLEGERWVGAATLHEGRQLRFVLLSARPPAAQLEPWVAPPAEPGAVVELRGTLRGDHPVLVGMITQGRVGVARCETDPSVARPAFLLRCPMAQVDTYARATINVSDRHGLMLRGVADALISRDPEHAPDFEAAEAGEFASTPEELRSRVLLQINNHRRAEGLTALDLAEAETAAHQPLAAALLAQRLGAQSEPDLRTSLALMAGWQVQGGTIADAVNFWSTGSGRVTPEQLVQHFSESPDGRAALLNPRARSVAIAAVVSTDPPFVGLVTTAYQFFEDVDHAEAADRVFARLGAERRARGLVAPTRMTGLTALESQAARVRTGVEPGIALRDGLNAESSMRGRPLRASRVETFYLDGMPWPPEFMSPQLQEVGVVVTHTRPRGAAWGQYVVFLVTP